MANFLSLLVVSNAFSKCPVGCEVLFSHCEFDHSFLPSLIHSLNKRSPCLLCQAPIQALGINSEQSRKETELPQLTSQTTRTLETNYVVRARAQISPPFIAKPFITKL